MNDQERQDQERITRYETLHAELEQLDDEALKERFWALCNQVMEPVVELARTHTSPSIERAVLLRMGIDSVTTHAVVENVYQAGYLGKGAGHAVLRVAQTRGIDIPAAAAEIANNPAVLTGLFEGANK